MDPRLDVLEASVRAERLLVLLAVLDERGIDPGDGAVDTGGVGGGVLAGEPLDGIGRRGDGELVEQPAIADVALDGRLYAGSARTGAAKVATPDT